DYSDNIFSFGFTGLDYDLSQNSEYAYRLTGFDKNWTITDDQRRLVTYTNISPGEYRFEVKKLKINKQMGSYTAFKKLTIRPPWWMTWWFRTAAISACFLALSGVYNWRLSSIRMQKKTLEETVERRTEQLRLSNEQIEKDKALISKSLAERESLLKEIHHRVKNNLQIIASLLYLQSGKFEDEDYKKVLEEGQGRVRSMALIHQKLYENEDLKSIPFDEYLTELVTEIRASFGAEMKKVSININAENIQFDIDTAIPLGLIVNEMATNAFKYAFEGLASGSFSISIYREENMYNIKIQDDGKGIPEAVDLRKAKSLGLRLVRMLSQQLEGEFQFQTTNGTSFELKFAA
ncbi:MAG: histidine kinase dimerization/phosphoacceptor domain -containing protein, partial [Cyclobacteriaceae bacterium]